MVGSQGVTTLQFIGSSFHWLLVYFECISMRLQLICRFLFSFTYNWGGTFEKCYQLNFLAIDYKIFIKFINLDFKHIFLIPLLGILPKINKNCSQEQTKNNKRLKALKFFFIKALIYF